jgi:hypothetical protein
MARAPPLRDVGRRADEIASWRRRTATARLRDLSSLRTGIFAAGMLSATPVDLRLSRLRGAGFRLRLNARDPREIASLISERPCSSPRCDRRNSRSRSRSAVSTSSWVAGILSICRHLNRQPNSRHRPVASVKIWLTRAFWPSESPPTASRELKRLHGQKNRPGVDLVRAGAGYSRSFVGAPTSNTCRLKFSDRWVLSRL